MSRNPEADRSTDVRVALRTTRCDPRDRTLIAAGRRFAYRTGRLNVLPSAIRLIVAAGLSAAAVALFARAQWPWLALGWVALVPWLAALDRSMSGRGALLAGWLMSEAFVLVVFSWLPSAIQSYSGAPWGIALLVVVLVAPLIEPQFVALALARHLTKTERIARYVPLGPLTGALAYIGTEWAMPKLFTDTLGHPLFGSTLLRQGADVAGPQGLTFVLLLANECALAIVRNARARTRGNGLLAPAACLTLLVLVPYAYGAVRYRQLTGVPASVEPVTAGLVQADLSHYDQLAAELGRYDTVRLILDTYNALSGEALARADLDLLVWPETVYPTTFGAPKNADGAAFDREIEALVARTGVPLVLGAYDTDGQREFNAAFFLHPSSDGRVVFDTYRKTSLFPFTERVPALLDWPIVRRWLPWLGTWTPGPGPRAVSLSLANGRSLRVAPLICYDALDPAHTIAAVRQGAELILTLSNDSWFEWGNVPELILVASAFRSVETRRPQLRTTSTGISAVVTSTGDIVDRLDLHERGVLVHPLSPGSGTTLMLILGDWLGPTALVAAAVLLIVAPARQRHRGSLP